MLRIKPENKYWSLHTHSQFSDNDALPEVEDIVGLAARLGQPALGIQDHGNMAASVQLYQACAKAGIKPFPGTELYMVPSVEGYKRDYRDKNVKATRYHLGVTAFTTRGYQNLVALNTLAHRQHFHKPLVDFATLAGGDLEGLAVNTGCYFSYLVQTLVNDGMKPAEQWLKTLATWFPLVYVEMQNHRITHDQGWDDDQVADVLLELADRVGLPAVITQDSHYLHESDRPVHDQLKRLVAWGNSPDDAVFPGDGFHLADHSWMADHHHRRRLERGLEGLSHLQSAHALSIPVLDKYHYAVPRLVNDPQYVLQERCTTALGARYEGKPVPGGYAARLANELFIIQQADMAGYMLLTADICDWMRGSSILFQTRGSAAGSLVCYLLGITNVDPIAWDLRFERFLTADRTKPPDIDLDVEHERREEILTWLRTKYSVHQISTWMQYSLVKDKDGAAPVGPRTGSLVVKYLTMANKTGRDAHSWAEIPAEHQALLVDMDQREIYSGLGKNAAGIVITSRDEDFDTLVPLHHMSSGEPVSQYNKDDVESLGLVKLDLLGSKTLTIIKRALSLIGTLDLQQIPMNDPKTFQFIRKGNTDGIFQLEGTSTRFGLRDLKPTTVKHIIAAMALFRPAIMRSGATDAYCRRKNGIESVPVRHELLNAATKDTFGVLLYQEQTVDLMRSLGMGIEDLNRFLKAIKASNEAIGDARRVIDSYTEWLITTCEDRGLSDAEVDWVVDAVNGFAKYSFNRAHATVYGLTAYYCAFLAVHYGLEFHTALLSVAAGNKDKEQKYLRAARARGISIRKPHINHSGESYTLDRTHMVIRKGLTSIDGVGRVAAQELASKAPYKSIDDLIERVEPRKVSGAKEFMITGDTADLNGLLLKLYETGLLEPILSDSVQ